MKKIAFTFAMLLTNVLLASCQADDYTYQDINFDLEKGLTDDISELYGNVILPHGFKITFDSIYNISWKETVSDGRIYLNSKDINIYLQISEVNREINTEIEYIGQSLLGYKNVENFKNEYLTYIGASVGSVSLADNRPGFVGYVFKDNQKLYMEVSFPTADYETLGRLMWKSVR